MDILHHHSEAEEDMVPLHEATGRHRGALMVHREEAFHQEVEVTARRREATVLLEVVMAR